MIDTIRTLVAPPLDLEQELAFPLDRVVAAVRGQLAGRRVVHAP